MSKPVNEKENAWKFDSEVCNFTQNNLLHSLYYKR